MSFIKQIIGQILLTFRPGTQVGEWYDLPAGWEGNIKVRDWKGYYLTLNDNQTTFHFPSVSGSVTFNADGSEPKIDANTKLMKVFAVHKKGDVKKVYRLTQINI